MGHNYEARLARAREAVGGAGLTAALVAPSADLLYLVGYDPPPLERLTALLIRPDRDPMLLVPELERPRAEVSPAGQLLRIATWRDGEDPYEALSRELPRGGRYAASDRMWASHLLALQAAMTEASWSPASTVLSALRIRKESDELRLLAEAGRAADDTFRWIQGAILEGQTEEQFASSLSSQLLRAGHESVAFAIVASAENAASPHHDPGPRPMGSGDPVVLDYGGRVGGYCSDMSRTVVIGEPDGELREVHDIVRRAQQAAFDAIRPGVAAEAVDAAARSVIEDAGYAEAFIHRTGHGIGLEEHEPPWIVAGNPQTLETGMCFSVEPGVYLEGRFGVRIEDIVVVTDEGATRLNEAPRQLLSVS